MPVAINTPSTPAQLANTGGTYITYWLSLVGLSLLLGFGLLFIALGACSAVEKPACVTATTDEQNFFSGEKNARFKRLDRW